MYIGKAKDSGAVILLGVPAIFLPPYQEFNEVDICCELQETRAPSSVKALLCYDAPYSVLYVSPRLGAQIADVIYVL